MNFNDLTQYFVLVVVVACLVVGYIIKHATFLKFINNDDIPTILAVLGAVLNCIVGGVSVETIVYGALMGLSSTGMHQAFTKFVESNHSTDSSDD